VIEPPDLPEYPAVDVDEAPTLRQFLDYQRTVVIRKVAGLSDHDASKPMTASGLSILGVIKHLIDVERWWFGICFTGADLPLASSDDDPDADFRIEPGETVEQIVAAYRAEIDSANRVIAGASLDQHSVRPSRRLGKTISMRWILVHMIEETARHAGHADLMRESLDGATGD